MGDEALAGIVIGLALPTALVLCLIAAEKMLGSTKIGQKSRHLPVVGAVLDELCERLKNIPESAICASGPPPKHLAIDSI